MGAGGQLDPECGRRVGLQEDPGPPHNIQTLKFFHTAKGGAWAAQNLPTYLHGCEKNKLALSTGRQLTLEGRRSGRLSRPAATTHSCHITPTALSCFGRVLVCFLRCTRHVYIIIQPTLSHHCAMKHLSRYFKHFTGIFCYSFIVFHQVEP